MPHPHIPHPHMPHIPHPHMPHIPHPHMPHIPRPHGYFPHLLDQYIHSKWAHYIFQCALATISLIMILIVGNTLLRAAIVVGVASSAFTVFVVPNSVAATPRKVIGGHFVAGLVGAAISLLVQLPGIEAYTSETRYILEIAAALSVGVGIVLMVVTNTEHPPAAGTSMGLVIYGFDWSSVAFILASALLLSVVRVILRNRMINLL